MKKNMGAADRAVRILAAITIAVLYYRHLISGTTAIILLVMAGVFIVTSLVSVCPLYAILNIRTCTRTT